MPTQEMSAMGAQSCRSVWGRTSARLLQGYGTVWQKVSQMRRRRNRRWCLATQSSPNLRRAVVANAGGYDKKGQP